MTEPRRLDRPQPGFFKVRLVKGGPMVPALIYLPCPMVPAEADLHPDIWCLPQDRSRFLEAEIDGKPTDIIDVWTRGREIPFAEYRYLAESAAWDRAYAPDAPAANPRTPIDLRAVAPVF